MRRRIWMVISVACLLLFASPEGTRGDDGGCGWDVSCSSTASEDCSAAPTSAQPMQPDPDNQILEDVKGGNCGSESCYWFFRCACGKPLATKTCNLAARGETLI